MKPAKRLLDGMPYTPSHSTDIRKLFAKVKREQAEKKAVVTPIRKQK